MFETLLPFVPECFSVVVVFVGVFLSVKISKSQIEIKISDVDVAQGARDATHRQRSHGPLLLHRRYRRTFSINFCSENQMYVF